MSNQWHVPFMRVLNGLPSFSLVYAMSTYLAYLEMQILSSLENNSIIQLIILNM